MQRKFVILVLVFCIHWPIFGQLTSTWPNYYIRQMYTGFNDTLYYGLDYSSRDWNAFPLMIWLTTESNSKDSLSVVWNKQFYSNPWITINPYLKFSDQWDCSSDTCFRIKQLKGLINVFIDRDDVIDTNVVLAGYNNSGIFAANLTNNYQRISKCVVFIDDITLISKCRNDSKITYIMPKSFRNKANRLKLQYILLSDMIIPEINRVFTILKLN